LLSGGGLFVDPEQPEQLLKAMREFLADDIEWRNMGLIAKQKAQKLTWLNSANQMQSMLSKIEKSRA